MNSNQANVPPITGYVSPLSGRPDDVLSFKISSKGNRDFSARVVRIDCADPNPAGPGMKLVPVEFPLEARYAGQEQDVYPGSCAIGRIPPLRSLESLIVDITVKPTLGKKELQVLLSLQDERAESGMAVAIREGRLVFLVFRPRVPEAIVETGLNVPLGRWTRMRIALWQKARQAKVDLWNVDARQVVHRVSGQVALDDIAQDTIDRVCLAAIWRDHPQHCFNGFIEAPGLACFAPGHVSHETSEPDDHGLVPLARWDFSQAMEQQWVPDTVNAGQRLSLVNMPVRAVRASTWSGEHMDWKTAPAEYAAICFHEDSLLDCGWKTSVELKIPEDTPSGVYGLVVHNEAGSDTIPFYVTPAVNGPRARILFLAPTLTYQAYANHARGNFAGELAERVSQWNAYPHNPDIVKAYGASTYNRYADGAGISLSSRLRPILTMRPGYLTFPDPRGSGLRHFAADSHLTDWLREKGFEYDVITDEDLDDQGMAALEGYDVVLTGSHPEYHTRRMLEAILAYRSKGGNLMYLGGNGFYWKIARPKHAPYVMEVRRAEGGIRAWASEPGEYYHQLDGGYGGLWRRQGLAPQTVGGVGFTVQGTFEGSYYKRTRESFSDKLTWLFEGVSSERIGDYGLSGGGAAGFELDQAASDLGTPDYVSIIAVSEEHGETFKKSPEEILTWTLPTSVPRQYEGVHAHMVYGEAPGGGSLFAVGSITFLGSLAHNKYDNDISRILENCLRRFSRA